MTSPPPDVPPPSSSGEEREQDDTIIRTVFLRSLAVLLVAGLIAGIAFLIQNQEDEPEAVETTPVEAPKVQERVEEVPRVRFTDITASSGIDFVHENGARGEKLLPETMGSGCAFLDHDGDGDSDLLFVNARPWPGSEEPGAPASTPALYENRDGGKFVDITADVGLDVSFYGMGVATGDHDGDGDVDLFFTALGRNRLFSREGDRYVDVTERAGVGGAEEDWSTSAGFFDADGDGDLDLFVCNYVKWSREIDLAVDFQLTGIGRAYGPPSNFEGTHNRLYRNEGEGSFTDVTEPAGIQVISTTGSPVGKALGVTFFDADGDGQLDILVANDTVQNFFFHNQGEGRFLERGSETGLAFSSAGQATGAMGLDIAHARNDDGFSIGIGNFANEMSSLYVTQGPRKDLLFTDEAITEGIGPASRLMLSFGLFFLDYDLDGRLDLFQTNGHLEDEINVVQPSQHYRQPAQLFWNAGPTAPHGFTPVDASTVGDLARPAVGRGAAMADIDGDGDLDIVITQVQDRPLLLRNDQELGHHWLRIRLRDRGPNPGAIGAVIRLVTPAGTQTRRIIPARSYLSQMDLPVTFGLGKSPVVERITVTWPDGTVQELAGPVEEVDRELEITRS